MGLCIAIARAEEDVDDRTESCCEVEHQAPSEHLRRVVSARR